MLLLIDCGNTNIVFAIAQNDRILKKWRINTDPKRAAKGVKNYIKDKKYDSAGYAQITISRHLIDFTSRSLVTFLLSLITLARLFYLSRIG